MRKHLLFALICLFGIAGTQTAKADSELYVVLTPDQKTMTLFYDDQREAKDGVTDWSVYADTVETIKIDASVSVARFTSTASWFESFKKVTYVYNLDMLNTSEVTDMSRMFCNCSSLTEIDLNSFDMSSATNIAGMFAGCVNLKTIYCNRDWSAINSESVFLNCTSLVGGNGRQYDMFHASSAFARPDTPEHEGYFTAINKIYAAFSADKKTMTIYHDAEFYSRENVLSLLQWDEILGAGSRSLFTSVTKAVLDESMKTAYPIRTSGWFRYLSNMTEIEHLDYLNTDSVTQMESMFGYCSSLESVDISTFNMEKVISVQFMFNECTNLKTIYCNDNWKTDYPRLTKTLGLFNKCTSLVGGYGFAWTINGDVFTYALPDSETSRGYFTATPTKKEIYAILSADQTQLTFYYDYDPETKGGVTDWSIYSSDPYQITTVEFNESMKAARPTSTKKWFYFFRYLTEFVHLEYLNTSRVNDMSMMFCWCISLKTIDLNSFDIRNLKETSSMFNSCLSLTSIYCKSDWSQSDITSSAYMFDMCKSLVGGSGTAYDASYNNDITFAHPDLGPNSNRGYFTLAPKEIYATLIDDVLTLYYDDQKANTEGAIDTWTAEEGATDMRENALLVKTVILDESMQNARPTSTFKWFNFPNVTEIQHLDYLNTSDVTNMYMMFYFCSELESVDVSRFDTKNVTTMASMFELCGNLKSLDLSNFNTENVIYMASMFYSCNDLTSLDLSSFDTKNVTNMEGMFQDCFSLTSLDIRHFDISKLTNTKAMFANCIALKTIYCDTDWSASKVLISSSNMFNNCPALIGGSGTLYDKNKKDKTYARPDGLDGNKGYFTSTNIEPTIVPVPDDVETTIDFAQTNPDGSENVFFAANASNTYNAESGQLEITTSLTDEQVEDALGSTVPGSALWVNMLPGSLVFDVPEGEGDIMVECMTLPGYTIRVKMEGKAAISITQASLGWAKVHYNTTAPTHVVIYLHAENPASAPARIATAMSDDDPSVGAYIKTLKITPAGVITEPTALGQVQTGDNADKVLLNGQLYLLRDGKTYNALGQEVR